MEFKKEVAESIMAISYFQEEPDFAKDLIFQQESAIETGKYQCDCDYVAFTEDGKKVVRFGNVAAHEDWGYIEE